MNECECNSSISKNKNELLQEIMSLSFSVNDLALYLDTHPNDSRALRIHGEYSEELRKLAEKYQKLYGPLTINYSSNSWNWIDEPWPWKRRAY